jgi:hypothetical protein
MIRRLTFTNPFTNAMETTRALLVFLGLAV